MARDYTTDNRHRHDDMSFPKIPSQGCGKDTFIKNTKFFKYINFILEENLELIS